MSTSDTSDILAAVTDPERLKRRLYDIDDLAPNLEQIREETGNPRSHTLGENMVRNLGMRRWPSVLESLEKSNHPAKENGSHPIVEHPRAFLDHLVHLTELDKLRIEHGEFSGLSRARRQVFEWLADEERAEVLKDMRLGGTDWLAYGPKGSGKSTLLMTMVARTLEVNTDAAVWRGSFSRSEWLPLRPWATVCLPKGLEVSAELTPPVDGVASAEVELEKFVRRVVRYESLEHLNHEILEEGGFHVVYPDPLFRGCTEATEAADEIPTLEHVSAWEARNDPELGKGDVTPTEMWWFAWAISKIEFGPPFPTSWFADEIGNLMPEHASNDYHALFRRIEAYRNKYVDARRNNFSHYSVGHDEDDLHHLMRKKKRWRITLNSIDNPVDEPVVGMGRAPMRKQYTSYMKLGQALSWNKQTFAPFGWDDIPARFKLPGQLHIRFPEHSEVLREC